MRRWLIWTAGLIGCAAPQPAPRLRPDPAVLVAPAPSPPALLDPTGDADHDGIANAEDACPQQAEDKDGFEDRDGCPELDDDHDGIPDGRDACPFEPEDLNGFQDDDGCPDRGRVHRRQLPDRQIAYVIIYFDKDDVLPERSGPFLDAIRFYFQRFPELRLFVDGHATRGEPKGLGAARAQVVVRDLVTRGVAPDRLHLRDQGTTKRVCAERSTLCRARGRRVDFWIISDESWMRFPDDAHRSRQAASSNDPRYPALTMNASRIAMALVWTLACGGGTAPTMMVDATTTETADAAATDTPEAAPETAGGTCANHPELVAAAPACSTFANQAAAVPFTTGTGAPPAFTGGPLRDGLYQATRAEGFGTAAPAGRRLSIVIQDGGKQWLWNGEVLDAAGTQVMRSFRANATASVAGNTVSFTSVTCLSATPSPLPESLLFTANGDQLLLGLAGDNAAVTTYARHGCP